MAGRDEIAREYAEKAARLKSLIHELLWDDEAKFFKVRRPDGKLADVREEIGFIPWCFSLPENDFLATESCRPIGAAFVSEVPSVTSRGFFGLSRHDGE